MYRVVLIIVLLASLYWTILPLRASILARRGELEESISLDTFVNYETRKFIGEKAMSSEDREFVVWARDEIAKEIETKSHDTKLWIILSVLNRRLGRIEEAKKAAQRAVDLSPGRKDIEAILEL